MSVLVDTTVLIDALRGSDHALSFLGALGVQPHASEISRVEVLRGMRSAERSRTERLLAGLHWVPLDQAVARAAGALGRQFRASHPGLETPDLIVAATAQVHGAALATTNVKHYPMFPDLQPPY